MAGELIEYIFDTFPTPNGGLSLSNSKMLINSNQYWNAQNLYGYGIQTVLTRRSGMSALGSQIHATNRIKSLYRGYSYNATNVKWLIETDGTFIRYRAASAWSNLATTTGGTGLYWDFETFKGKVLMCDGTSTSQAVTITTDPPTIADWTTMPSSFTPSMVRRWKNRILIAGNSATKDRVHISEFGDETTFKANNYFRFKNNQSGEEIVKLEVLNEEMIVLFGANSIETWTGNSPISLRRYGQIGGRGCIAKRTVVVINGMIYYFGKVGDYWGIYRFDGYNVPEMISWQIQRRLNQLINITYISDMWAINNAGCYELHFTRLGSTNINNCWILFDPTMNNFCGVHTTNETIGYDCGVQYQIGSGDTGQVYYGTSNGYAVLINDSSVFKDNSTSYPVEFISGILGYNTRYNLKKWKELHLMFWNREYHPQISIYYDLSEASSAGTNVTAKWQYLKDISISPFGKKEGDKSVSSEFRDGLITEIILFSNELPTSKTISIRWTSNSDYPIYFAGGKVIGEVI